LGRLLPPRQIKVRQLNVTGQRQRIVIDGFLVVADGLVVVPAKHIAHREQLLQPAVILMTAVQKLLNVDNRFVGLPRFQREIHLARPDIILFRFGSENKLKVIEGLPYIVSGPSWLLVERFAPADSSLEVLGMLDEVKMVEFCRLCVMLLVESLF